MNKRRLFYDESWLISYDSLKFTGTLQFQLQSFSLNSVYISYRSEENNLRRLTSRRKSLSMDDLTNIYTPSFDKNRHLSAFTDIRN